MIFKKHKPKIKFHAGKEVLASVPHPVPAHKMMPAWFKKIKPTTDGKLQNGTIKRCMPVLDAVSQGFIIPLWADLHVKVALMHLFKDKDGKVIHIEATNEPDKLVGTTTDQTKEDIHSFVPTEELTVWVKFPDLALDEGHLSIESHTWDQVGEACDLKKFKLGKVLMKLHNPWVIETTPGYSVQIKNPSSNWENELNLVEGVVDSDTYYSNINFPFVWTGSEVGEFIIPKGTPIAQVIPFKRDNYTLEVSEVCNKKRTAVNKKLYTKFFDRYKTMFWHKRKK